MSTKKNKTNGAAKKPAISAEEKLLAAIHGEPKARDYAKVMSEASAALGKVLDAIDNYRDSKKHMKREGLTLLAKVGIKAVYDRVSDAQELCEDLICAELDYVDHERRAFEEMEADVKAHIENGKKNAKMVKDLLANPPMKSDKGVFYTPAKAAEAVTKEIAKAKAHATRVAVPKAVKPLLTGAEVKTAPKAKHNVHGANGRFVSKKAAK